MTPPCCCGLDCKKRITKKSIAPKLNLSNFSVGPTPGLPRPAKRDNLNPMLPKIEISPKSVRTTIIWLHGLGADGHDFEPIAEELNLPETRFIFPHAPYRQVTINQGMRMRAWFDIRYDNMKFSEDEAGVRESEAEIHHFIEEEQKRGIPSNKIFLAGFSQGGAVALYTALKFSKLLGGVLALSTYLPLAYALKEECHKANQALPIFMAHGREDSLIPISAAQHARELLGKWGYEVDWHEYAMPHSVCPEEVKDIRKWLIRILAPSGPAFTSPKS